jgi:hypothetical protein
MKKHYCNHCESMQVFNEGYGFNHHGDEEFGMYCDRCENFAHMCSECGLHPAMDLSCVDCEVKLYTQDPDSLDACVEWLAEQKDECFQVKFFRICATLAQAKFAEAA